MVSARYSYPTDVRVATHYPEAASERLLYLDRNSRPSFELMISQCTPRVQGNAVDNLASNRHVASQRS